LEMSVRSITAPRSDALGVTMRISFLVVVVGVHVDGDETI